MPSLDIIKNKLSNENNILNDSIIEKSNKYILLSLLS
jgi:hypothetical protein